MPRWPTTMSGKKAFAELALAGKLNLGKWPPVKPRKWTLESKRATVADFLKRHEKLHALMAAMHGDEAAFNAATDREINKVLMIDRTERLTPEQVAAFRAEIEELGGQTVFDGERGTYSDPKCCTCKPQYLELLKLRRDVARAELEHAKGNVVRANIATIVERSK